MARQLIGTAVTDANGEATITYTGTGAGKLNIVAESGTFLSEIYEVEDMDYVNIATSSNHKNDWITINNCSVDIGTTGTRVYGANQNVGESMYAWNHLFNKDDDFIMRFEYVTGVNFAPIIMFFYENQLNKTKHIHRYIGSEGVNEWKLYEIDTYNHMFTLISNGQNEYHYGGSIGSNLVNGDIVTIKRVGTSMKLLVNDVEVLDTPVNITQNFYMGMGTHYHANRSTTFKNWRIHLL